MSDIAIKVESVSKCYPIFDTPRDRLKQMILPRAARLVGANPKKYYREFWALKDVSFHIRKGESLGVVGHNGAGKSTLLQIIAGTLAPTAGSVDVNGKVVALLELGSGFNPDFTGRENIYLSCAINGLTHNEADTKFDAIAAFADIGDFLDQPVKTYSSGMAMRLAFSVLTQIEANILIVDEALSVGDAFFVQKCMRFIRKFMEENALLFVSHSAESITSLCSHALWIKNGCVMLNATPRVVVESYMTDLFGRQRVVRPIGPAPDTEALSLSLSTDSRMPLINNSNLRNDLSIEHLHFSADGVGSGDAIIETIDLQNPDGKSLAVVTGGERVRLVIQSRARRKLVGPIVGFSLKNKLGVVVFGDNTYLTFAESPLEVEEERSFLAIFDFIMPRLPVGDFMIECAIAEGTQTDFIVLHKIIDAIAIKAQQTSVSHGQLAIPMNAIKLEVIV
jgi:lipopolysaccharide transport system ATP-binding protein